LVFVRHIALLLIFFSSQSYSSEESFTESEYLEASEPKEFLSLSRSIIHSRDFEKVRDLSHTSLEYSASKKVAYLELNFWFASGNCSGFLVGPQLLLTNNHCIHANNELIDPEGIHVYMNYLNEDDKGPLATQGQEVLVTNQALDYALIKLVDPIGLEYGWLELEGKNSTEQVVIIQHPQGRSKEITRVNGQVMRYQTNILRYESDTEIGSSGSPVFISGSDRVIAMHHFGDPDSRYNEGIRMSQILPTIKKWLPKQAVKIRVSKINPIIDIIERF